MRSRRERREVIPPQDVRIRQPDGTVIECDLLRDPDQDRDGCTVWAAVPREHVTWVHGSVLEVGVLPPKTSIDLVCGYNAEC